MKSITALLFFLPFIVVAQKMPDLGIDKIRINEKDRTIVAEIDPVGNEVTAQNELLYYWYAGNAIHSTQGGYSGRLLNGGYTEYYLSKNLKEQGTFKNGQKNGSWKTWNADGLLVQELNWKKGRLSGKFILYNSQGRIKQSGIYENDMLQGPSVFNPGTDSAKTVNYKNGKILDFTHRTFWQKIHLAKKKNNSSPVPAGTVKKK